MKGLLSRVLVLSILVFGAGQASAVTIQGTTDPVNNTADFTWSVNSDGNLVVSVQNTSNFFALITGFQFEVADDVSGVTQLVGVTGTLDNNGWSWTTGVTGCDADECLLTGRNLNGGNPQDAVGTGGTGSFTFSGSFIDPSTLTNIMVRFQQTGESREGSDRGYECRVDCEPAEVPEPGTLALFGLGLLGLRVAKNRRIARS